MTTKTPTSVTPTDPSGARPYDHAAWAQALPEWHAAAKALDALVHALNRTGLSTGQAGWLEAVQALAAGLSFLGLGTKPPEPEWGLMLNTLRTAIYVNPWVAALPGAMIFAVSICFNLLSDGMRSAMDIRN